MSLFFLLLPGASANVLLNEVYYDAPSGVDEGASEWIELCNPSGKKIDLSGWTIESGGSGFSESWTFPGGTTIAPGGYLVFGPGAGDSSEFSPNLQNGGSETDGVRLLSGSGTVIDTLLYDTNNTNGLVDDNGSTAGPFAPDVSAGNSLVRFPNCSEWTNDGDDWIESEELTPGAANPSPADCSLPSGANIIINELMPNPPGSDGDSEWIEIYNTGTEAADLAGWSFMGGTSSGGSLGDPFPDGSTIAPGEYLVIGGSLASKILGDTPDIVTDFSLGNASSNADGVMLADCNGTVYDTVIYGGALNKEDGWTEDDGTTPDRFAPIPGDGAAIGRMPNGVDSDRSGDDFQELPFPTPWQDNDIIATCDGQDDVKINEFMPNPDSEDTSADDLREWIELINTSSSAIDLAGWEVQWGTSGYSGTFILPPGTTIPAGGFLVVGGDMVPEADVVVPEEDDIAMGAASSSPDAVRLLHCGPGLSDTVIYGPDDAENSDEWTDDSEAVASEWGPKAVAGLSIARRSDGVDTDNSSADFVVSRDPSPGQPNPIVRCESGDGSVLINEIFPDPSGSDGGNEWLELVNTGDVQVALDDWSIQTGSSSWNTKFTFPPETVLEPGEYMVIGDDEVPSEGVDLYSETNLSLGNASTGLDGVRLLDCPGDVSDTLLYGKDDAYASEDEEPWEDDAGGQSFARFPSSNLSLGRIPDAEDSDDNGADFQADLQPSPGQANVGGGGGPGGGEPGGGGSGGCGQDPAAPDDPSTGKCSVSPMATSPLWTILLVGLLRRRDAR
jgi:hypothetical protein